MNKPLSGHGVMRQVRHDNIAPLQNTVFHSPARDGPTQPVRSRLDSEIGEADFISIPRQQAREAEVLGFDLLRRNVKLVVASIVALLPLQLFIVSDQQA